MLSYKKNNNNGGLLKENILEIKNKRGGTSYHHVGVSVKRNSGKGGLLRFLEKEQGRPSKKFRDIKSKGKACQQCLSAVGGVDTERIALEHLGEKDTKLFSEKERRRKLFRGGLFHYTARPEDLQKLVQVSKGGGVYCQRE